MSWVLLGNQGLRAGWAIFLFLVLGFVFWFAMESIELTLVMSFLHRMPGEMSPLSILVEDSSRLLAILMAGSMIARLEGRRLFDFNLSGPSRLPHFLSGLAAGFASLSVLVGVMAAGGWLHFGPVALSGGEVFRYAAIWGVAFLLVGFSEEGCFRCYLQFTLTRSINFWWALGIVALLCGDLMIRAKGNGVWGVYAAALIGLLPCFWLYARKAEPSSFWYAAWVTSTGFGFIHTSNNGENWIGIFAAAAIGFVFCVSIRLTGSAWWAIGCHAAWDWAETYFYGTADSGLIPVGHFLSSAPNGNPLWSGGTDGPEGGLLVLPVILLMLILLLALYGRKIAETPELSTNV